MKSSKSFLVVLSLISVVFFSNCGEKTTYYKLSDSDMSWLHYENNQKLYFQSLNGDLKQFDIVIRLKGYQIEGNTYTEFTGAYITQVDDSTIVFGGDNKGELYISKVEESLLVTLTWPHFPLKNTILNTLTPSLANIGGLNFSDVMILDGSVLADNRNYITKIWVSKSQGVLQMEDLSGVLWTRTF